MTVICHTYNHAPYIRQTLESMLMQKTNFSFDIIVHDDASTDGTAEIVCEISAKVPDRIFPILQKDNQFSRGRRPTRFTFPRARGEFIALCEGDDYWISSEKLQKQVDSLRRYPEVNLCVHPAMRLSMRNGKQKKGFDHGSKMCVLSPNTIIGRHDQFAPTASVLMRSDEANKLPSWFFDEPGLPVGDFFIEAIVGRKGVLYIPDVMSVYRRDVPGSYTNRFRQSSGQKLEDSMRRMLNFTERLRGMEGIPGDALDQRLSYIRLNYALQFLAMEDRERFASASRPIYLLGHRGVLVLLAAIRSSRLVFWIARSAFLVLRRWRGDCINIVCARRNSVYLQNDSLRKCIPVVFWDVHYNST